MGRSVVNVTIPNGGTVSGVGVCDRGRIVGIIMPAAWTAGNITIKGGPLGTSALVDKGHTALGVITTPAANEYVVFLAADQLEGIGSFTLTAGAAQGADRIVGVVVITDD